MAPQPATALADSLQRSRPRGAAICIAVLALVAIGALVYRMRPAPPAQPAIQQVVAAPAVAAPSVKPVSVPHAADPRLTALDREIASLQRELAALRARYTDLHPDVVRVNELLAQTRRERAALRVNGDQ